MAVPAGKTPLHSYFPGSAMAPEAIPFDFGDPAHIVVRDSAGAVKALGSDYTITGDWEGGAASITALAAVDPAVKWMLWSETPREQQMSLQNSQAIDRRQYTRELDRGMRAIRELSRDMGRVPSVPMGETAPDMDPSGLQEGDVLVYRGGKLQRHDRAAFAGKFLAGSASGALIPASGTGGGDTALRGDLAGPFGGQMVGLADGRDLALVGAAVTAINIDSYGADSDFATALESAIALSQSIGARVVGTPGKPYYSRRRVQLTDPSWLDVDLSMSRVIRADDFATHEAAPANPYSASPVLEVIYSHATPMAADGALALQDVDLSDGGGDTTCTRIPLASTTGLEVGDYIRVISDDIIPWSNPADDEYLGQDARIAVVNSGSIDLYGVLELHDHFQTNVRIAKKTVAPCRIAITGSDPDGWYDNPDTDAKYRRNRAFVRVIGAVQPRFPHMAFSKLVGGTGLETWACYQPEVDVLDCEYLRTSSANFAYGYGWVTADTYPTLFRPRNGRRVRHMITSRAQNLPALTEYLNNGGSYPSYQVWEWGGSVRGEVTGGNVTGCEHAPYDLHSDAYQWTFNNPKSSAQIRGPSAGQSAVNLRGDGHTVNNLDADGGGGVTIIPYGTVSFFKVTGTYRRRAGITTTNYAVGVGDNGGARPRVVIDMDVIADDDTRPCFSLVNCDVDFRGSVDWAYTGASGARVFSLTAASLRADLTLDVTRATGTNMRIVRFEDAASEARIRARVLASGQFLVAELNNHAALCFAEIDPQAEGQVAASAFANASAARTRLKLREQRINGSTYTTTGNKSLTWTNRWAETVAISIGATTGSVVVNSAPVPTVPGQTLIIANTKSDSTESLQVKHEPGLLEVGGSDVTLAVGESLTLTGDPFAGKWVL